MRTSVLGTAVAVVLVVVACDDTTAPVTSFRATLDGADEVPAVSSTGAATASITLSGTTLSYTLTITTAPGSAITVAHIHTANAGVAGPIRVNLCGTGGTVPACPAGAGTLTGTFTVASGSTAVLGTPALTFDGLVSAMRNFGAYVNVHTATNAGGEIRGQLLPAP